MFGALERWMATASGSPMMENFSNEKVMDFLSSPVGLGIGVALIIIFILLKWKLSAVITAAVIGGVFIVQYILTDASGEIGSGIYVFIGAAAILGAFIIYFTLMRED